MATVINSVKVHFKTAHSQREIVLDVKVTADMTVGTLVNLTGSGDTATITAATSETVTAGQYIVAQSDMTIGRRDYTVHEFVYSDKVKASTELKKVAVYRVNDPSDILIGEVDTTVTPDDNGENS